MKHEQEQEREAQDEPPEMRDNVMRDKVKETRESRIDANKNSTKKCSARC